MTKLKDLVDIFLQPGEYFVADAEYQLRTMLGSCVSMTLWDPTSRIGAMSHFLLPTRGQHAGPVQELDGRYGDEALELMRHDLLRAGVRLSQCQAKLFGGGNMFPGHARNERMHVGRKNGEAARKMLIHHGIPIVSESLFGIGHRQIIFDVSNGDVWAYQVKLSTEEAQANGLDA